MRRICVFLSMAYVIVSCLLQAGKDSAAKARLRKRAKDDKERSNILS